MAPNVRAAALNSTAVVVQWDRMEPCIDVNGIIIKYRIQYQAQPSNAECINSDVSVDNMIIVILGEYDMNGEAAVTGLTPFTVYSIQVAAVNEEGDVGVYSEPQHAQTPEDGEAAVCGKCIRNVFFICSSSSRSCDCYGSSFFFQDSLHLGLS